MSLCKNCSGSGLFLNINHSGKPIKLSTLHFNVSCFPVKSQTILVSYLIHHVINCISLIDPHHVAVFLGFGQSSNFGESKFCRIQFCTFFVFYLASWNSLEWFYLSNKVIYPSSSSKTFVLFSKFNTVEPAIKWQTKFNKDVILQNSTKSYKPHNYTKPVSFTSTWMTPFKPQIPPGKSLQPLFSRLITPMLIDQQISWMPPCFRKLLQNFSRLCTLLFIARLGDSHLWIVVSQTFGQTDTFPSTKES